MPAVTYDHHCILSFMGEDWRIAVVCGTLIKLRNARTETIVDVAKMDWPTYQAAALAWDECPDGFLGPLQEVPSLTGRKSYGLASSATAMPIAPAAVASRSR